MAPYYHRNFAKPFQTIPIKQRWPKCRFSGRTHHALALPIWGSKPLDLELWSTPRWLFPLPLSDIFSTVKGPVIIALCDPPCCEYNYDLLMAIRDFQGDVRYLEMWGKFYCCKYYLHEHMRLPSTQMYKILKSVGSRKFIPA